jgi:hypothetical protein
MKKKSKFKVINLHQGFLVNDLISNSEKFFVSLEKDLEKYHSEGWVVEAITSTSEGFPKILILKQE